jgi:PAS domain S-box-containing protein
MCALSVDERPLASEQLLAEDAGGLLRSCSSALRSALSGLPGILALTAVYVGCGKFGLSLAFVNASASAVWPPTGVALVALLVWGYRLWPGVFLGALLVNITTQGSLATSLGIAGGNTCEALIGAWLVRRFAGGLKAFERTSTFFQFVLWAGVVSTTVSPAVGVTALCLGGFAPWGQYHHIWLTWWLGDMISNLIIAPLLLIWLTRGLPRLKLRQVSEVVGLLLTVILVGLVLFLAGTSSGARRYPVTYLALLPLLWAAFRFGERGAVTAAFVMDGIALWGTLRGYGPFVNGDPNKSLLLLQTFVGTAALTAVTLALALSERRMMEERLALVIQGSSDGVWDWDVTTNEVYFSRRWKSLLGYNDQEVEPRFSAWEQLLHPDDRERALASVQAYLAGRTPSFELEHRLRHKDGSYRWILSRGVALRDGSGQAVRMAGSHVDLTERKQAEERLQQAYAELSQNEAALKGVLRKLQAANEELQATQLQLIQAAKMESVGTLAAGVAHEVKNPLQTILMGLDYLANNPIGGNGNASLVLSDMREAVTRANAIVRELLQLSAATDFDLKPEDLNAVLDRSLSLIHSEVVASRITVVRKLGADLPRVRLDRSKMEQVFINLFINALHAMSHNGALTVATRYRRFGEDLKLSTPALCRFKTGDPVVIAEVQDTGKGIPQELLPRIFDPFFTTKPAGLGTGLGLSVVKKIMDLHGGSIAICNNPLGGVLVTLLLRAEHDQPPESKPNPPEREAAGFPAPNASAKPEDRK